MAAGVHHAVFNPIRPDRANLGRVGQPGLLNQWQSVHIGADQHSFAGAIFHHRDNPGFGDARRYGKTKPFGLSGHNRAAAGFLETKLGMRVKIAVNRDQRSHISVHRIAKRLSLGGCRTQQCSDSNRSDHPLARVRQGRGLGCCFCIGRDLPRVRLSAGRCGSKFIGMNTVLQSLRL